MTFPFEPIAERRSLRARAWWLGAALALLSVTARAEDELELVWNAPAGCPSAAFVRQRFRALAGSDARLADSRIRAEGNIERTGGRYRLTLTLREGTNVRERTIESASCADLGGAAAVALGLLLRNDVGANTATNGANTATNGANTARAAASTAANERSAESSTADSKSNATGSPETPRARPPAPTPASSSRDAASPPAHGASAARGSRHFWPFLRVPFVTLDFGPVPKPSGALGVGLGARYDAWRFLLSGRVFSPQTLAAPDLADVRVRLRRSAVAASVCRGFQARSRALEVAPCASVGIEPLVARGSGVNLDARSARAVSVVVAGGATGYWYLVDWMALTGSIALGVETSRPRLGIDVGNARTLGPLEFSLGLGPEWIF